MRKRNLLIWIRHKIFTLLLEKVVFQEAGFERNHFGSIISPLEIRVAWDHNLTERALKIRNYFSEVSIVENSGDIYVRLGSQNDGGYILPKEYQKLDSCISGGIGDDNNFEYHLALNGMRVLQFDPSIEEPPHSHKLLIFRREGLGNGFNSLLDATTKFAQDFNTKSNKLLLKLDIEGFEWEVLDPKLFPEINSEVFPKLEIIVIEFHGLSQLYDDLKYKQMTRVLDNLLLSYSPIWINGNNCRTYSQIGGVPILDVLECTFVRRNQAQRTQESMPNLKLTKNEFTNVIGRAPLHIQSFINN